MTMLKRIFFIKFSARRLTLILLLLSVLLSVSVLSTVQAKIFIRQSDGSYIPLKYSDIGSVEANIYENGVKVINTSTTLDDLSKIHLYGKNDLGEYAKGIWITEGEHVTFPITTTPTEYANYKIVINGTTWEIYNVSSNVSEASGTISDFWSKVNSDGSDIRVFNDKGDLLYFWFEEWDYNNQTAIIWVNLTAGSSELDIAYGNPSATKSAYEDGGRVFEFFDDFDDLSKWTVISGSPSADGTLYLPAGDSTTQEVATSSTITEGVWEYKQKLGTGGASPAGDIFFYFMYQDANNLWGLYYCEDQLLLSKKVDGSWTNVIIKSITTDNQWHTLKVVRDSAGNWKVYVDGELIATASDSWLPSVSEMRFQNKRSESVEFDKLRVYKLADPADFGTPSITYR